MNIATCIMRAYEPALWSDARIVCFTGTQYPSLFFQIFFDAVVAHQGFPVPYKKLYIPSLSYYDLTATINQTFLGMSMLYWLGDISALSTKDREKFTALINHYQGDNVILFFTSDSTPFSNCRVVTLPAQVDHGLIEQLLHFFAQQFSEQKRLSVQKFLQAQHELSLDTLCMYVQHMMFMQPKDFSSLPKLLAVSAVSPELLKLTEALLQLDEKQFYYQWSLQANQYTDIFWVIFWSEVMWKAYHIIHFLEQKKFVEAKKMSYRMPNSFIQYTWKKYNKDLFARSYQFLYAIDFGIKQGSTCSSLDLFYVQYFQMMHDKR